MSSDRDVTRVLERATGGDSGAVNELLPLVYEELRRLAESHLRRERSDHTLQATALVHEAYLKLVDQTRAEWRGRAHFFAVAAQAIRRILVDHARGKGRQKRGSGRRAVDLDVALVGGEAGSTDVLDLDDAMRRLAEEHPDKVRVVELRFFGGLTSDEAAEVIGVTTRTVERQWQFARAWLYRDMAGDDGQREA